MKELLRSCVVVVFGVPETWMTKDTTCKGPDQESGGSREGSSKGKVFRKGLVRRTFLVLGRVEWDRGKRQNKRGSPT